jgi:hypothetical protein
MLHRLTPNKPNKPNKKKANNGNAYGHVKKVDFRPEGYDSRFF